MIRELYRAYQARDRAGKDDFWLQFTTVLACLLTEIGLIVYFIWWGFFK